MVDYIENINNVIKEIENNKIDVLILGDNSIGKSDVLKKYIDKHNDTYYIDSYNRVFNYKNISLDEKTNIPCEDIIKTRIDKENFNLKDSFFNSNIENYYEKYKHKMLEMLEEFLKIKLDISLEEGNQLTGNRLKLTLNDEIYENISSGYQAIIRIFSEIIYAKTNKNIKTIVIDEINEFLSAKNENKILTYLKEKFPDLRFIVTTHSADVIASMTNAKLIILKKNNYEILDVNDYEDITDVRMIFKNLYFKEENKNLVSDAESALRSLYNKQLFGEWNEIDQEKFNEIEEHKLSNTLKIIYNRLK